MKGFQSNSEGLGGWSHPAHEMLEENFFRAGCELLVSRKPAVFLKITGQSESGSRSEFPDGCNPEI